MASNSTKMITTDDSLYGKRASELKLYPYWPGMCDLSYAKRKALCDAEVVKFIDEFSEQTHQIRALATIKTYSDKLRDAREAVEKAKREPLECFRQYILCDHTWFYQAVPMVMAVLRLKRHFGGTQKWDQIAALATKIMHETKIFADSMKILGAYYIDKSTVTVTCPCCKKEKPLSPDARF